MSVSAVNARISVCMHITITQGFMFARTSVSSQDLCLHANHYHARLHVCMHSNTIETKRPCWLSGAGTMRKPTCNSGAQQLFFHFTMAKVAHQALVTLPMHSTPAYACLRHAPCTVSYKACHKPACHRLCVSKDGLPKLR